MNRLKIDDPANCTGCGACQNMCPHDAISMNPDPVEGFCYPAIDDALCVDCGKCIAVCPLIDPPLEECGESLSEAYVCAAWSQDEPNRLASSSGGVFGEMARWTFEKGGMVAGAVFDDEFAVRHVLTASPTDLPALRQSKYAQSDTGLVFREIAEEVKKGRAILFCGTPCQTEGLRAALGQDYPNLLLCDFICHGVPSPKAFRSYLAMQERRYGAPAKAVEFRNKAEGWKNYCVDIQFSDGERYHQPYREDLYMRAFFRSELLCRPSCHACRFKGAYRNTDLTIGDFWGINRIRPELDEDKGTSVVLVSSEKGMVAMEAIRASIACETMTLADVAAGNPYLTRSALPGKHRDAFFAHLDRWAFDKLMKRFGRLGWKRRVRQYLGRCKRSLKRRFLPGQG